MGKRRNIINISSVCLIPVCLFLFFYSSACAEPKIIFTETSFDFGKIPQKQKVSHVFTVKNEGDRVLKINRVNTSCGCTAAIISSKDIMPGDSGQINIEFDSGRRRGKQEKIIYVNSNDTVNPVIQLKIKSFVEVVNTRLSIVTTIFPLQEFARAVGKEFVSVDLLPPDKIISEKLSMADILFYIGSDREPWLKDILKNNKNPYLTVIDISRMAAINPGQNNEQILKLVWFDFLLDQKIIDIMANILTGMNSTEDTKIFRSNAESYKNELKNLKEKYMQINSNPSADLIEKRFEPGATFLSILQADLENLKKGHANKEK